MDDIIIKLLKDPGVLPNGFERERERERERKKERK
jgi:hypothetical protein